MMTSKGLEGELVLSATRFPANRWQIQTRLNQLVHSRQFELLNTKKANLKHEVYLLGKIVFLVLRDEVYVTR